jgi:hypothetical protein
MGGIMRRNTIIFVLTLLMLGYFSGFSQVSEKKKYHEPDSADVQEGSGRIILDGILLEPPYEIVVQNDTLKINGYTWLSKGEEPTQGKEIDPETRYGMVTEALDSFGTAYRQVGYDSAINLMLDFFNDRRGDLVDSAYFDEHYGFFVKFKDVIGPHGIWFEPPKTERELQWERQHQDSILIKEAIRLKKAVGNGNLIILGGKGGQIYLGNAQKWLKKINKIVNSDELSREEKLVKLSGIVMHEYHAECILQNWKSR